MPTVTTRVAQTFKKPSIAESYGTFATLQAAMTYVENADIKCAGLTVGIDQPDGSVKEYWLQPVEGQLQFVEKGGTEVEANPEDSGEYPSVIELSSLKVGKQVYMVPSPQEPDAQLSSTSTNSVQNKVVKSALDAKANASDIPSVPTISTNIESDATSETMAAAPKAVKTYVDSKVSSAYKAAGSVANVASLPTLIASNIGKVCNMTSEFTTTSDFVEGSGKTYPAGTNVAVVEHTTGVYKYDVLAGFVDLSGKADKSEMSVTDGTGANADKTTIQLKNGTNATVLKQHQNISGKVDKVSGATPNNFASFDANGGIQDSNCNEGSFIKGVKKGTETLTPVDGVVTVPSDIEGAQATSVPSNQSATATIDSNHVLQLGIPRGEDAYNPFKGTYLITDTLPTTGQAGDYIYVVDSQTPPVTHVYTWNGTIFTDSGETVVISDSHFADIPIPISQISLLSLIKTNFSNDAKQALITLLEHVAWVDGNGSNYINSFRNLLFALNTIGIRAEYTQNHTVWSDGVSTLDDLKQDLTVYAIFSDNSEVEISEYVLSGTLASGTSIITVTYGNFTSQFNVTVTQYGSKMSYTMAEGTLFYNAGQVSEYTHNGLTCLGIDRWGDINARRVFPINFGIQKMWKNDGSATLNAYAIKIPYGAKSVVCNISGDTQEIGCRVLYRLNDGHFCNGGTTEYPYVTTPSYETSTNSLDISSISERSDAFLFVWGRRTNNVSYEGHEPTAIEVIFSNE